MKKLIISAITAAALLFGFAGCSGDLHDDEKKPIDLSNGGNSQYYLVGSMTNNWSNAANDVVAGEKQDDGTYKFAFSADAAEVAFAFLPTPGSWNGQIGGNKMTGGSMPANAKFESKDNGNGGFNGVISGLEAKNKYKLIVSALDDGTLKIDCSSNVPPTPVYLHNMYVRGGMIDWNPSVEGSLKFYNLNEAQGLVTYSVDFICKDVANDSFGVVDGSGNWAVKYTGATVAVDGDYVVTKLGADDNNKITGLKAGCAYRIFVQTNPAGEVSVKVSTLVQYKITGCKLTGYIATGDVYFLEAWVPGNAWGTGNGKAEKVGNDYVKTFSTPVSASALAADLKDTKYHIQIVDHDGKEGTFWNKKVTGGSDASCEAVVDGGEYTLVYDKSHDKCSLVKN